jgi:hypothetical protein
LSGLHGSRQYYPKTVEYRDSGSLQLPLKK